MKRIILILSFILILSVGLTGCKNNKKKSIQDYQEESLEISDRFIQLILGETRFLSANYTEIKGNVLSFSSSDPSIAEIDDNGKIQAISLGNATISVQYGKETRTCEVEVTDGNKVPMLQFEDFSGDDVTLTKGETFNFKTLISFNDSVFTDGNITYELSNDLGKIDEDGLFTAGEEDGDLILKISGEWKNISVHDAYVNIHIISNESVVINGGRVTEFHLYTVENFAGNEYANKQVIDSVCIEEDGMTISDFELSVEDTSIASLTEKDGKQILSALKYGNTILRISFQIDGVEKEYDYEIHVEKPMVEYPYTIENFSILDGTFYDATNDKMETVKSVLGDFEPSVVSYDKGKLVYQDEKILGLPTTSNSMETYTLTLQNDEAGYIVIVEAYAKVVDELSDFTDIMGGPTSSILTGYYVLAKDLIDPDTTLYLPKGYVANSFGGVFDGNGHVITCNFSHENEEKEELVRYGLFGFELRGTIKNVAFDNIKTNGTSSRLSAGFLCVQASDGSLIQDIYLNISFTTSKAVNIALMYSMNWSVTIKNIVVIAENIPTTYIFNGTENQCSEYGTLGRGTVKAGSCIYVVSTAPVYHNDQGQSWNVSGLNVFESQSAFESENVDCSKFNTDVWDTTNGYPTWKTLNK